MVFHFRRCRVEVVVPALSMVTETMGVLNTEVKILQWIKISRQGVLVNGTSLIRNAWDTDLLPHFGCQIPKYQKGLEYMPQII